MRISATIFVILISTYLVNSSVLDPVIENVVHLKASKPPNSVPGIWKKKTIWKPRWVKEWKSAKVMKPVWRKVWSPIQIREWVPIPKPPPGWDSLSTPLIPIHPKPQKVVKKVKDSVGHGSNTFESTKTPLWDPVPYPESQQPPPLPFLEPLHSISCGSSPCDNSPSQTFHHQQISEIIGRRYQTPEYFSNPEFSETVNYQTRLPPEENNWRPPQTLPDFRPDNNFQALPEFLIPPKFQSLPQISSQPPWVPLPPENKIKGHFVTKTVEQPNKFQQQNVEVKDKANTNEENFKEKPDNDKIHTNANREFIQEAQLVGEYHYSTFDQVNFKPHLPAAEEQQFEVELPQASVEAHKPPQALVETHKAPQIFGKVHKAQQTSLESHKPQQAQVEAQKPLRVPVEMFKARKEPVETHQHQQNISQEVPNQLVQENKVREIHNNPHVQKKHTLSHSSTNSNNFLQQEVVFKEIQQKQNFLSQNLNLKNHFSTKLQPLENSNTTFHIPPQSPIFMPPNQRFSSLLETKSTQNTTLKPEKNNTVQIVFGTTPAEYHQSTEKLQKSTTTEPYEIIFSSSLQATTEAVTKSAVIIVTPANSKENP